MILTPAHFTRNLSTHSKMTFVKMLESLHPSIKAIMMLELEAGNKIFEVRSGVEQVNDLVILLQHPYHQNYENEQLTKLVTTDAHDHGVYYMTDKPMHTLIAPYDN